MSYFNDFPLQFYSFGDGEETALVQNLAVYVDILDDIKMNSAFYQDYNIQGGERPDQTAFMLYKNLHMHWTFYFMNDKIREQGWPVAYNDVVKRVKSDYPDYVLTTQDSIHSILSIGDTITGAMSQAVGIIKYKNLDLGQIYVEVQGNVKFQQSEMVVSNTDIDEHVDLIAATQGYLATHHYEVNGEHVDLDLTDMSVPTNAVPVTNLDSYLNDNDKLKQIRVITPREINTVQQLFKEALR